MLNAYKKLLIFLKTPNIFNKKPSIFLSLKNTLDLIDFLVKNPNNFNNATPLHNNNVSNYHSY